MKETNSFVALVFVNCAHLAVACSAGFDSLIFLYH
jgi:hypothetical protein